MFVALNVRQLSVRLVGLTGDKQERLGLVGDDGAEEDTIAGLVQHVVNLQVGDGEVDRLAAFGVGVIEANAVEGDVQDL
jgi:hypothetical protein